jgi:hypothetical protein
MERGVVKYASRLCLDVRDVEGNVGLQGTLAVATSRSHRHARDMLIAVVLEVHWWWWHVDMWLWRWVTVLHLVAVMLCGLCLVLFSWAMGCGSPYYVSSWWSEVSQAPSHSDAVGG